MKNEFNSDHKNDKELKLIDPKKVAKSAKDNDGKAPPKVLDEEITDPDAIALNINES